MKDLKQITIPDLIKELNRENAARKQVYPKLIELGKLDRQEANYRYACISKAIKILQELDAKAKGQQLELTPKNNV